MENPDFRVVRTRNNFDRVTGDPPVHAETPGHPWLGRILVVHHPATVAIQNADLLRVNVGDILTLLGQPFWMWHTTDLLEGNYIVPATKPRPTSRTPPRRKRRARSRFSDSCKSLVCSRLFSWTRTRWIKTDVRAIWEMKKKRCPRRS